MNRIFVLSLFVITLMLSACSDNTEEVTNGTEDEVVASETESDNELTELEEENEELRKEIAEKENEELKTELEEESEDEGTSSIDSEDGSDKSDVREENNEEKDEEENQNSNRSELMYDINSKTTQDQLLGTTGGNEDGTFSQSAITKGMSQTEVEEKYGEYDFTLYTGGTSPAFYGNLAVVYSAYAPVDESTGNEINPDENYVEYVWYYADITEEELINAFGEPDDYNEGGQTMNGLPYYAYQGEGEDGRYYSTGAGTFETPDGYTISIIKRDIMDEAPDVEDPDNPSKETDPNGDRYFEEYYTSGYPVELSEDEDYFTYDTLRGFIFKTYLDSLADYFNDENDDVLYLLTGNALTMVEENKSTGYFANHQNHGGMTVSAEQISETEYTITVNRTYSHTSTDGEETSQVTYTIVDTDGMLKVSDFQ